SVTLGNLVMREVTADPDANVIKDVRRRATILLHEAVSV
ncbi:MAG: DNA-binding protein, partial [Zoogloeaceae bacterium]|nr:DNA-binding protein [Zoogloeaceae bacterium]